MKNAWLIKMMADPDVAVRSEVLANFRMTQSAELWPTISLDRRFEDLERAAKQCRQRKVRRKTEASGRKRGKSSA